MPNGSFIYRPDNHLCAPHNKLPYGSIYRCDTDGVYWKSDGNGRWTIPIWPWGKTAKIIKADKEARRNEQRTR